MKITKFFPVFLSGTPVFLKSPVFQKPTRPKFPAGPQNEKTPRREFPFSGKSKWIVFGFVQAENPPWQNKVLTKGEKEEKPLSANRCFAEKAPECQSSELRFYSLYHPKLSPSVSCADSSLVRGSRGLCRIYGSIKPKAAARGFGRIFGAHEPKPPSDEGDGKTQVLTKGEKEEKPLSANRCFAEKAPEYQCSELRFYSLYHPKLSPSVSVKPLISAKQPNFCSFSGRFRAE